MDCRSLSKSIITDAVKSLYGITVHKVSRLGGYVDVNFYLESDGKQTSKEVDEYACVKNKTTPGDSYVMKIKTYEPMNSEIMMLMLNHCKANNLKVPGLLSSLTGKASPKYFLNEHGQEIQIQLFEFVEGKTVFETELTKKEFLVVSRNVGTFCGLFTKTLAALPCNEESIDPTEYREDLIWRLEYSMEIVRYTHHVQDKQMQDIVTKFFKVFQTDVKERLHLLPRSFIQSDFSDTNVVLCDNHASSKHLLSNHDVTKAMGLIDFEDAYYGYTVFEIAICIAYMMMTASRKGLMPHEIARELLVGYRKVHEFTDVELDVLYLCVLGRLITSYVMSVYSCAKDPDNSEVYTKNAASPQLIKSLSELGKNEVINKWISPSFLR